MSQSQTQIIGILLAVATAIGCVAYEKIVKGEPFWVVSLINSAICIALFLIALAFRNNEKAEPYSRWWIVPFVLSGVTYPMWYWLTRHKNVLSGAIFEIKYIAVLVLCSVIVGSKQITVYTVIGALLAMASIYFISK